MQGHYYRIIFIGDKEASARGRYREFVRIGIEQARRSDLIGAGFIRSQGGWAASKALRRSGANRKDDERILGDRNFVEQVLSQTDEGLQEKY
jgi:hypothetical protein